MSSEDAADYMNELAQGNAAMANEFRITTVSMEKVFYTYINTYTSIYSYTYAH